MPYGILSGGPGGVRLGCLLFIGFDPLVNLISVGAVVADGRLHEAKRNL